MSQDTAPKQDEVQAPDIQSVYIASAIPDYKQQGKALLVQGVSAAEERRLLARYYAQQGLAHWAGRFGNDADALTGWAFIVSAQAKLAFDTSKGRSSTEAARFVADVTGFTVKDAPKQDNDTNNSVTSAAIHAIYDLVTLLRDESARRNAIDGVIVE